MRKVILFLLIICCSCSSVKKYPSIEQIEVKQKQKKQIGKEIVFVVFVFLAFNLTIKNFNE